MKWWRAFVELLSDRQAGYEFAAGLAPMFGTSGMGPSPLSLGPYVNPYTGSDMLFNPYLQDAPLNAELELANARFWQDIMSADATRRAWDELLTEPKPWGD